MARDSSGSSVSGSGSESDSAKSSSKSRSSSDSDSKSEASAASSQASVRKQETGSAASSDSKRSDSESSKSDSEKGSVKEAAKEPSSSDSDSSSSQESEKEETTTKKQQPETTKAATPPSSDSESSASSASSKDSSKKVDAGKQEDSSASSESESSDESESESSVSDSDSEDSSASSKDEIAATDGIVQEEPYSPMKDWFTDLPEPQSKSKLPATNDPFLKGVNSSVDGLRAHVLAIQKEEETLLKSFTDKLRAFGQEKSKDRQEDSERIEFLDKLEKIRKSRKHFRGLLYDAIKQRNGILESYDLRKKYEEEKENEYERLEANRGFDFFLFVFLIWQALIMIAYIIIFDFKNTNRLQIVDVIGNPGYIADYASGYTAVVWMVFLGFGLWRSYKKYSVLSALGQTFFAGAYAIQWGILILAFFYYADISKSGVKVDLSGADLIEGAYIAFTVIISFGVLFGRIRTPHLIWAVTVEVVFYGLNHYIGVRVLNVVNPGRSIYVHTFGGVFGLVITLLLDRSSRARSHWDNLSSYHSEKLSMLGWLFMWILWPTFNAAITPANTQLQAVVNTFLCMLVASCTSILVSVGWNKCLKWNEVQHASIAGGILMGSATSITTPQYIAFPVGALCGIFTVLIFKLAYNYQPKLKIQDTTVSFVLHALYGTFATFMGMVATAAASRNGMVFAPTFEEMFAEENTRQSSHQLASLVLTWGFAIGAAIITAIGIRLSQKNAISYFYDNSEWRVASDYPAYITRETGIALGEMKSTK